MPRVPSEPPPTADEQSALGRIEALAAEGRLTELLDELGTSSWIVRRRAIAAVAALGDAVVEPLGELLRTQRHDETRLAAVVDALTAGAGTTLEPSMLALTRHENPAVVADAVQVLGRRRSHAATPRLSELTNHADDNVAVAALEALGRIGGKSAVEALVRSVQSGNFFRTFPAIDVLGRSGDPRAVEALAALLDNPNYTLEAARALGRTADRAAVELLVPLLARPSDAIARVAATALQDLEQGYATRFGTPGVVEAALRGAAPPSASRRLAHAVVRAGLSERIAICWVLGATGDQAAAPVLTGLLDAEPSVASAAAAALKKLEQNTEQELLDALRIGTSARRAVILPLLTAHYALARDVVECLSDEDASVRALACETLARIGNPSAVTALFARLGDPNIGVVHAAVGAIQSLGSTETERLALDAARSGDERVRRAALRIIGYFGYSSALNLLLEVIAGDEPRLREVAVEALPFIEDARAIEGLLSAARHPDGRTRAAAARAFGQCVRDLRVTSFLLRALSDPEPWVRYYACRSLGRLAWVAAAEPIARLLSDDAGQVRVAAVEALSHLPSEAAFEALREAAASPELDLRRAALLGLGIGKWQQALPVLVEAVSSPDVATRLVAVSAVADFSDPMALAALGTAARDPDEAVRNAAIGFLAAHTSLDATQLLIELLPSETTASQALAALSAFNVPRLNGILAALETANDEVAPLLISALMRMRHTRAIDGVLRASNLPNPAARRASVPALAVVNTPEALAALERLSSADADREVERVAALVRAR